MSFDPTLYKVTRFCCTSGQCLDCYKLGRGKRIRMLHVGRLTRQRAQEIAARWASYDAKVEEEVA